MIVSLRHDRARPERGPEVLSILGSTGSIGSSALSLVREHPEALVIHSLVAGKNIEKLHAQVIEFKPRYAALADEAAFLDYVKTFGAPAQGTELLWGPKAVAEVVQAPEVTSVLAGIVGFAGLSSVLSALAAGKKVALANKESLVCGGELVKTVCKKGGGSIIPVDSEHNALFQALLGHGIENVANLILTASGGPFLHTPQSEFSKITPEQAVKHPRWDMGAKISVDSATMVNKALELIEAYWLFGMSEERIKVIVHPQSIIHSIVEYCDGGQIAQLSHPDMRSPIAFALGFPHTRFAGVVKPLDLAQVQKLEFFQLDADKFPAVGLARDALRAGGTAPAVFNLANEHAVNQFLSRTLGFHQIVPFIEKTLEKCPSRPYVAYEDLLALSEEVRETVQTFPNLKN